jgi:hypothetical protein
MQTFFKPLLKPQARRWRKVTRRDAKCDKAFAFGPVLQSITYI